MPSSNGFLYFHSAPLPSIHGLLSTRRLFNFNLKVWKDDLVDPTGGFHASSEVTYRAEQGAAANP